MSWNKVKLLQSGSVNVKAAVGLQPVPNTNTGHHFPASSCRRKYVVDHCLEFVPNHGSEVGIAASCHSCACLRLVCKQILNNNNNNNNNNTHTHTHTHTHAHKSASIFIPQILIHHMMESFQNCPSGQFSPTHPPPEFGKHLVPCAVPLPPF